MNKQTKPNQEIWNVYSPTSKLVTTSKRCLLYECKGF